MDDLIDPKLFKIFFDSTQNPAIISSSKGKYLYVNKAFLNLRGLTQDQLIGHTWWDTFKDKETKRSTKEYFKESVCEYA